MDLLVLGLLQKILRGSGNTVIDVIIDAILSETSENPVQNKVITKALKNKADISHKHTAVEVGADSIGSAETALNDSKKYTDGKIADIINGAPSTLDTLSEIATAMDENKSVVDALDKAIGTKANKADIPTELPANGGNADTVNNHTVNTDVPSDAVFTDTVYILPKATTEILGGVIIDGTSIIANENGVISAVGSGSIEIDTQLSDTSENPVQNKVITDALNNISASSAEKLNTSAGSSTKPVYFSGGKPVACSYTLGKSVPSNAVFTDTVYTLPKATTSVLGGVKVDGTTIAVDSNGVISTAGGLTVDTLLDITVNGNTPSPANNSVITLAGNMTDYKFVYFLSTYTGIVKYDPEPLTINSSILEWSTYTSGTYLYNIYQIAEIYYISSSKIKITYNTKVLNDNTERLVILGIK